MWTDELNIYSVLGTNYRHGTVKHKKYYVDPTTGVHTNHVEGFWGTVKRMYRARRRKFHGTEEVISE